MVPMLPNWRHIPYVRDVCAGLGVSKMSLLRFVPQGRGLINIEQLGMTVPQFAVMQHMISKEVEANHLVSLRVGCPLDFRHAIGMFDTKQHPCHAGEDLILVRPDGMVHPCAAWKTLPADDNVRDRSLKDIWEHGSAFTTLRSWHEGDWKHVKGQCASCKYQSSCKNGCPAQRLHAYTDTKTFDDLFTPLPDPLCPLKAV